jgi:hypothetical protein
MIAILACSAFGFSIQAPVPPPTVVRGNVQMALKAPLTEEIWGMSGAQKVQGNTLKTWDVGEVTTKRVQLSIKGDGRPINANVELWHTPSYIPAKFRVYARLLLSTLILFFHLLSFHPLSYPPTLLSSPLLTVTSPPTSHLPPPPSHTSHLVSGTPRTRSSDR